MMYRVLGFIFLVLTACSQSPSNFSLDDPKRQKEQELNRAGKPSIIDESARSSVMGCISGLSSRNRPGEKLQSNQDKNRPAGSHSGPTISLMSTIVNDSDLQSDPFSNKDVVISASQEAVVKYVDTLRKSAEKTGKSMVAIHLRGKSIDTFCLDQQKDYWQKKMNTGKSASLDAPAISAASSIHAQKYDKALRLINRLYNSIHDLLDEVSADELSESIARNHLNTQFSLPKSDFDGT